MSDPSLPFDVIAFDADDTLWVNEPVFHEVEHRLSEILSHYIDTTTLADTLFETEMKNLELFGYGVKGFTLSMIETALELTQLRLSGADTQQIIELGKGMLARPVELLEGVRDTILRLEDDYQLMIITKGDLFDQESKIARSALATHFAFVEILSDKTPAHYERILRKYEIDPARFLMVGNSIKSDILPVLRIGGHAVHIPFHMTWQHEQVSEEQVNGYHYHYLQKITELRAWLARLQGQSNI